MNDFILSSYMLSHLNTIQKCRETHIYVIFHSALFWKHSVIIYLATVMKADHSDNLTTKTNLLEIILIHMNDYELLFWLLWKIQEILSRLELMGASNMEKQMKLGSDFWNIDLR